MPFGTRFDRRQPFVEQTGLVYVRGCEVQGMLDDKGRVIEEGILSSAHACTRDTQPTHSQQQTFYIHSDGTSVEGQTVVVMVTGRVRPDLFALTFH